MPDWAIIIRAAKYLGVAPWDLMNQPAQWLTWAMWLENAEYHASIPAKKRK